MSDQIIDLPPQIPLAGVIGAPIAHSRSSQLHGYWLKRLGLAGHYVPLHVAREDLEHVLATMPRMGFVGANVTIPHKEAVLTYADSVTDRAAVIGAANTLTFRDGRILADNTDGYGFIENLRQGAPDWRAPDGPALVVGAGGAARAVIATLVDAGVPEIRVSNRTRTRAQALKEEFGQRVQVIDWVQASESMEDLALLVNASSLGMQGKSEWRLSLDALPPSAVVSDLVYTPLKTLLLQQAEARGCKIVDGLGMLLHQAVPGFDRWFGQRPPVDDATRTAVLA